MLPMTTNFARHGKRKWFNRLYEQPLITSATWLTAHIAPLQGAGCSLKQLSLEL